MGRGRRDLRGDIVGDGRDLGRRELAEGRHRDTTPGDHAGDQAGERVGLLAGADASLAVVAWQPEQLAAKMAAPGEAPAPATGVAETAVIGVADAAVAAVAGAGEALEPAALTAAGSTIAAATTATTSTATRRPRRGRSGSWSPTATAPQPGARAPVERTESPQVDEAGQQQCHEHQRLGVAAPAELTQADGPGKDEHRLEIEDHEEHGDLVELDRETRGSGPAGGRPDS